MKRELREMHIGLRVVTAVAQANGDDPTDLQPLTDVVDPDAVDQLFETPSDDTMELKFEYEGYTVAIDNTREISLHPVDEGAGSPLS